MQNAYAGIAVDSSSGLLPGHSVRQTRLARRDETSRLHAPSAPNPLLQIHPTQPLLRPSPTSTLRSLSPGRQTSRLSTRDIPVVESYPALSPAEPRQNHNQGSCLGPDAINTTPFSPALDPEIPDPLCYTVAPSHCAGKKKKIRSELPHTFQTRKIQFRYVSKPIGLFVLIYTSMAMATQGMLDIPNKKKNGPQLLAFMDTETLGNCGRP
ncbi:hypothetical protein BO82DRAFT_211137 [Aspergillus uvarum CBS 121591]|uniref:Uncharacterized protein n=1 Tax=Aspergillus uvarum CBS 121591 TaxID=1448315 RepID=A0A319CK01_9EURO|nr:hypothetical protein BO82DRAFT_211137 [Aspergillus uvarum CBS 121591]PYH84820.1 hypothetical protein BO82DRAFT_211137 [Aspergillus uvarum CBS 121591]